MTPNEPTDRHRVRDARLLRRRRAPDDPTMEEHLSLHPEDALCPECNAEDWLGGAACPRCWGDLRRGEDCPKCKGTGSVIRFGRNPHAGVCRAPGCRCGRLVEPTR